LLPAGADQIPQKKGKEPVKQKSKFDPKETMVIFVLGESMHSTPGSAF
jgi:glucan phosphoethanolaminetransferase (alkaline phosphatase superfamily)